MRNYKAKLPIIDLSLDFDFFSFEDDAGGHPEAASGETSQGASSGL